MWRASQKRRRFAFSKDLMMDVKTVCLGVLTLGDASGYEIRKQFEEGPFAHFHEAGFGSIYPALNALSRDGFVTCEEMVQEGRPDKKVYTLTSQGRDALSAALLGESTKDKYRSDHLFKLFFAEMLPAENRRKEFDTYLAYYREELARMSEGDESEMPPGPLFVHRVGLAAYKTLVDCMEREGHLLFDEEKEKSLKGMEAAQ